MVSCRVMRSAACTMYTKVQRLGGYRSESGPSKCLHDFDGHSVAHRETQKAVMLDVLALNPKATLYLAWEVGYGYSLLRKS